MAMAHNVCIDGQRVIGTFSANDEVDYINDDRTTNRRFYLDPGEKFNFNYEKAFEGYTAREGGPCAGRYAWMRDHRQVLIDKGILDTDQSRLKVDFISHCGVIASMLKMGGQDLVLGLAVTLYKGTYHLHSPNHVTTVPGSAEPDEDIMLKASTRLLLKFVTSRNGRTPDELAPQSASQTAPVNDNETFNAMMTVNCGNHPLLVCFEIQAEKGITDPPPDLPNPRNCLNVRSSKWVRDPVSNEIHPKIRSMKALGWWAPNVIAGIPEICCGLRDDHDRTIERIETIKIDKLVTSKYTKNCWDSGHCIRTLEHVLSKIKELVPYNAEDDPNSFKRAVLTIRSVDGGSGMNREVDIKKREGKKDDRREDEIRLIFQGQ